MQSPSEILQLLIQDQQQLFARLKELSEELSYSRGLINELLTENHDLKCQVIEKEKVILQLKASHEQPFPT